MTAKNRDPYYFGTPLFNTHPYLCDSAVFFGLNLTTQHELSAPAAEVVSGYSLKFFAPYDEENDSHYIRMHGYGFPNDIATETQGISEAAAKQVLTLVYKGYETMSDFYWPDRKVPPLHPNVLKGLYADKACGILPYVMESHSIYLPPEIKSENENYHGEVENFLGKIKIDRNKIVPNLDKKGKLEEMKFIMHLDPMLKAWAVRMPKFGQQFYTIFRYNGINVEPIIDAPTFRSACFALNLVERHYIAPTIDADEKMLRAQFGKLEMHTSKWENQKQDLTAIHVQRPGLIGRAPLLN